MELGVSDRPTALTRTLIGRIAAHWRFKMFFGGAILIGFYTCYFLLQRYPLYPITLMPPTALDRLVGFHPEATLLYLSLWIYIPIAPWLADTRRELRAYTAVLGAVSFVGLVIFLFWPTAVSRPEASEIDPTVFRLMVSVDGLCNACPSLHATFAVFCGFCNGRTLRQFGFGRGFVAMNWIWAAGILYATLATKQHVIIDLLFGALLGILACLAHRWLLLRGAIGVEHG